jgi:NADH-quinone oxidoreductase subunit L
MAPLFPPAQLAAPESSWLAPALMAFMVFLLAAGWRLAHVLYVQNTALADLFVEKFPQLSALLIARYRVDEFYHRIFVEGLLQSLARPLSARGETQLLGYARKVFAKASEVFAQRAKKIQTGSLQHYAFTMGLGLAALIGFYYLVK